MRLCILRIITYLAFMKYLILLLTLPILALGQMHENAPTPAFSDKAIGSLSNGLTGWCLTTDNQWVYGKNTIPKRLNSHEQSKFDERERAIGTDNIINLRTHLLTYGQDTLILLIKESMSGHYDLERIKKRWREQAISWFFVIDLEDFQKLQNTASGTHRYTIPLLAEGKINQTTKNISDDLLPKLNLNKKCNYELVFVYRQVSEPQDTNNDQVKQDYIQFQLFSHHRLSGEVEGIVNPFLLNGKSVMLQEDVLEYCHYQISAENWSAFVKPEL